MGDFDGKKFYGYAVDKDPEFLTPPWDTKNFEFSCIRPETIQRAIDKVQSDVGASIKQKKTHLLSKLREKGGEELKESVLPRDKDVETHISQAHEAREAHDSGYLPEKTRHMSGTENGHNENSSHSSNAGDSSNASPKADKSLKSSLGNIDASNKNEGSIEEYQVPKLKWVEIVEPQLASMQVYDLQPQLQPIPPQFTYPQTMYQNPAPYPYMPATPQMMQAGYTYAPQQLMGNCNYQDIYTDYDPRAYLVEDSDLEDEMLTRAHYTKYCRERPNVDEMNASDDNEGCAEFVNIAPQEPYTDMSCLKSTAPMRYSEISDDEMRDGDGDRSPLIVIKNRKESHRRQAGNDLLQNVQNSKDVKRKDKTAKSRINSLAQLVAEEKMLASTQRGRTSSSLSKRPRKQSGASSSPRPKSKTRMPKCNAKENSASIPPTKTTILPNGKSIEQLKAEKIAIFNKMSRTHERIIEALDQLRMKLLEIYEPESMSDRNRRNRNGFEFSVRFLRNFLYPLKGMTDTMRNTPKDQFNSASSNDACNRVAHIFSLYLQAILAYDKQLRHFMIDQVPQKLTTLLEMLSNTTNLCLDKRLFDRNDSIVDCLLGRCKNFLSFLENLHAQRFLAARESYRKSSDEHPESKYNLKMFMNDLNMYEPKLVPKTKSAGRQQRTNRKTGTSTTATTSTAYAVAPVSHPVRRTRKRTKQIRNASKIRLDGGKGTSNTSDINVPKQPEQDVPTQMQNWEQQLCSSEYDLRDSREIIEGLQEVLMKNNNVDKYKKVEVINHAILDTLQKTSHEQVFNVLEPLLKTINDALETPEKADDIENILKAFQTRISTIFTERNFESEAGKGKSLKKKREGGGKSGQLRSKASASSRGQDTERYFDSIEGEESEIDDVPRNAENHYRKQDDDDLDDEDGQFYISGEDTSEKRTTLRSSRSKLEPLVEIVDENDAAEIYSSEAEIYTPFDVSINLKSSQSKSGNNNLVLDPKKPSPYDSQRSLKPQKKSSHSFGKTSNSKKHQNSSESAAPSRTAMKTKNSSTSSKIKLTTNPPSPAMMRLKQRGYSIISDRSKKQNILRKHNRRDPMGSPPPVPSVSPSTSFAPTRLNAASTLPPTTTTSTSQKGPRANAASSGTMSSSDEISHQAMTHLKNENLLKTYITEISNASSKVPSSQAIAAPDPDQLSKVQNEEVSVEENDLLLRQNMKHIKNKENEFNRNGAGDHIALTLHPGRNPYQMTNKSELQGASEPKSKVQQKSPPSQTQSNTRVDFDETALLKERDHFLSLCIRNRLYTNPNFTAPWKIFSRLSKLLTEDIIQAVETDFSSGISKFVDDFLDLETKI